MLHGKCLTSLLTYAALSGSILAHPTILNWSVSAVGYCAVSSLIVPHTTYYISTLNIPSSQYSVLSPSWNLLCHIFSTALPTLPLQQAWSRIRATFLSSVAVQNSPTCISTHSVITSLSCVHPSHLSRKCSSSSTSYRLHCLQSLSSLFKPPPSASLHISLPVLACYVHIINYYSVSLFVTFNRFE